MKLFSRIALSFLCWSFSIGISSTTLGELHLSCGRGMSWGLGAESVRSDSQYAPDRLADIQHLLLDVRLDFERRSLNATARLEFQPIAQPLRELSLHAVDLHFSQVKSSHAIQHYEVDPGKIVVTFQEPIPPDTDAWMELQYSAEPQEGLYFRTADMGYDPGDVQCWTQGEPEMHRHWFPSHDFPNEKFTTEIICQVPDGMTVLSNGRLVSVQAGSEPGWIKYHWLQDKPHVNYLVSLIAGFFEKLEDEANGVPLAFYTPPSQFAQAANSFRDTKAILQFFEEEIGVPYPWAKYYNVCVRDFMWGGMENTSITTLTDRTLFTEATENIHSTQGLDAHEMAHQWFGDLVTCKDWSHIWLNEGFATYYEALFDQHKNGPDAFHYRLWGMRQGFINRPNDERPIVSRDFDDPEEQFRNYGYLAYPKGAWMLHMLREQLGPELFRDGVRLYLERHQYGQVATEDLKGILEEVSGRSWDRFFDQWLYEGGHPALSVRYDWDETTHLAHLQLRQTHKNADQDRVYHFPLTIRFRLPDGVSEHTVPVRKSAEDFYIPLPHAPEIVRVDPRLVLLAKIEFSIPNSMLEQQITDDTDMLGRLLAVMSLKDNKTQWAVGLLRDRLEQDSFHGVRIQAIKSLNAIHTPEAQKVLIDLRDQADARVRLEAARALGRFYSEECLNAIRRMLATEHNPAIQSQLLEALGQYPQADVEATLLDYLRIPSYRQEIAQAAITAMKDQDDPAYVDPIMSRLSDPSVSLPTRGYARALRTLAYLGRHQEHRQSVREFLTRHVNDPKRPIQIAALNALGELGDPKAIPLLRSFTSASATQSVSQAAKSALQKLQNEQGVPVELGNLRREVLQLKTEIQELDSEISTLKKQVRTGLEKPRGKPSESD